MTKKYDIRAGVAAHEGYKRKPWFRYLYLGGADMSDPLNNLRVWVICFGDRYMRITKNLEKRTLTIHFGEYDRYRGGYQS